MIDTHTHLNFKVYKSDWREVARRAVESGVRKMIVVGTDIPSSYRAVEMANAHKALFASVGIHPHHAKGIKNKELGINDLMDKIKKLIDDPKVVAVGEVGLDYHKYRNSKYQEKTSEDELDEIMKLQKLLFISQVKLAEEMDKPLLIHSREAKEDVINLLKNVKAPARGVFHCFEGNKKLLKMILDEGFYVSFTGNITYDESKLELASKVPLDRLLLETDSPFMTPEPHRGKRNEPAYVKIIAKKIAFSHGVHFNEVIKITTKNARELFKL